MYQVGRPLSVSPLTPQIRGLNSVHSQVIREQCFIFRGKLDIPFQIERKQDGSFVTSIDKRVSQLLNASLPSIYFAPVITEEDIPEQNERINLQEFWLVDPLDNTAGVVEGSLKNSALNISLIRNGFPVLGAVYYFGTQELFLMEKGHSVLRLHSKIFSLPLILMILNLFESLDCLCDFERLFEEKQICI